LIECGCHVRAFRARAPWFRRNEVAAGLKRKPDPAAAGDAAALPVILPGNFDGKRCRMLLFYGGSADAVLTLARGDPFTRISGGIFRRPISR
jgi:hypothetical protein